MSPYACLPAVLLTASLALGQSVAVFPSDYSGVPEGPLNSQFLPLAYGSSRVQCLYETADLQVPSGHRISRIGFRQDASVTQTDLGRSLQLEVRMGYSTATARTLSSTFDTNFASPPLTVFGPALFALPNLRDPSAPLVDGRFLLTLATPFLFTPGTGQNLLVEYRISGTSGGGTQFNYYLDRADFHSVVTQGPPGCPHSGGTVPQLSVLPTRPGLYYTASMTTGPANSFGALAMNVGQALVAPFPLGSVIPGVHPSCAGQVALPGMVLLSAASGSSGAANWSLLIPNDSAFSNLTISSQCLFLDFFVPGELVVSNGSQVVTGTNPRAAAVFAQGLPAVLQTGSLAFNYCPVTYFVHQ